jgi:hypothetical protein
MSKKERQKLIQEMAAHVGALMSNIDANNLPAAYVAFARIVGGLGVLAIDLDELMHDAASN